MIPGEYSDLHVADFNGDGLLDLVLIDSHEDIMSIYLQSTNNEFVFHGIVSDSYFGLFRSNSSDLDNDGDLDLLVSDGSSDRVLIFNNHGDATFAPPTEYDLGKNPHEIRAGDLDNDGDQDLVISIYFQSTIVVMMNDGNGGFPTYVEYNTRAFPSRFRIEDLDNDGDKDLAIATRLFPGEVCILENFGDGTFQDPVESLSVGTGPLGLVVSDLNNDGISDIITVNEFTDDATVLIGLGGMQFLPAVSYPVGNSPMAIVCIDTDNDADLDLVVSNEFGQSLSVLINQGDGQFVAGQQIVAGDRPRRIAALDLTDDGHIDLLVSNSDGPGVSFHESVCTQTCPADLTADGDLDFFDVSAFLTAFGNQDPIADFTNDDVFDFFDVSAFLVAYQAGCP